MTYLDQVILIAAAVLLALVFGIPRAILQRPVRWPVRRARRRTGARAPDPIPPPTDAHPDWRALAQRDLGDEDDGTPEGLGIVRPRPRPYRRDTSPVVPHWAFDPSAREALRELERQA